eukprot:1663747-Pyramimonas_sp.AAC.1
MAMLKTSAATGLMHSLVAVVVPWTYPKRGGPRRRHGIVTLARVGGAALEGPEQPSSLGSSA